MAKRDYYDLVLPDLLEASSKPEVIIITGTGGIGGAERRQEGLAVQAEGGTFFLDEIGELPFNTQKTLLRCLQERHFRPLGAKQDCLDNSYQTILNSH